MLNVCFYIKLLCNCGCLMYDDNSHIGFHSTHPDSTAKIAKNGSQSLSYKVYFLHCVIQAEKTAHHNDFILCIIIILEDCLLFVNYYNIYSEIIQTEKVNMSLHNTANKN